MSEITDPQQIFNSRKVVSDLAAIRATRPNTSRLFSRKDNDTLEVFKRALQCGQAEVRSRIDSHSNGRQIVSANTFLIDRLIKTLFDEVSGKLFPEPNPTRAEKLSLVALGGYGRGDMAPYSDVDLMFLYPWKLTARMEQIIESILYTLWDIGLKVGHAARSIEDCLNRSKKDYTIRTSVLEARYICGDRSLYNDLRRRFRSEIIPKTQAQFIRVKLAERDDRHSRLGDSRYLLEPNIKDGKGGLRDLHTLFWIAKYLYIVEQFSDLVDHGVITRQECRRFIRAEDFLWRVRAQTHVVSGRAEDQLTFDLQPEIALRMGYENRNGNLAVERFMKHYFLVAKTVGELTRIFCAALEADRLHTPPGYGEGLGTSPSDGIFSLGGRLVIENQDSFAKRKIRMIKIFRISQINNQDIHPQTLRQLQKNLRLIDNQTRENKEANSLFIQILTDKANNESTLRRMNEAGVLGKFIPEFGRIVAQTQLDMYHVYTVDEHTIRAMGVLSAIERGLMGKDLPLASSLISKVISRRALYVALFLHDLAKGRGDDHSTLGAEWALRLCLRFGLSIEETDTVSWLVRNHLLLSNTAFKRDVHDPKTLLDFVGKVQSIERLRLLLVLTAADIHAVGPGKWNAWKGSLLRSLYKAAEEILTAGYVAEDSELRVPEVKSILRKSLINWTDSEFSEYANRHDQPYWLTVEESTQIRHAEIIREADKNNLTISVCSTEDEELSSSQVTFYAEDQAGLFASAAGALALSGATILDAKVFTTIDGMAIDTFRVQNFKGGAFNDKKRLEQVQNLLEKALIDEEDIEFSLLKLPSLPTRKMGIEVAPRVLIDNSASARHTVIEVTAKDRPGLLYAIARQISRSGLTIVTAHVATFGERAIDVFYVKDRYGLKISDRRLVKQLQQSILKTVKGPLGDRREFAA